MKKPGAEEALEGTELWMGATPEAAAAAEVVWCSLASSLAFCHQHKKIKTLEESISINGKEWIYGCLFSILTTQRD